jgi:hypothetical protein
MSRKSAYEVALEKGDYRLPKDVAHLRHDPFEDGLYNFIIYWKLLGRPDTKKMYHLLMWADHQRKREETAEAIGLAGRESVRQMIKTHKTTYQKNKARLGH